MHPRYLAFCSLAMSLFSIFLYVPLVIFSANSDEFTSGYLNLISHLFLPLTFLLALAAALIKITPLAPVRYLALIFTTFALLIYVQSSFLLWDYGVFDGNNIKWEAFAHRNFVDISVWALVIVFALIFRDKFLKASGLINGIIACVFLINILSLVFTKKIHWKSASAEQSVQPVYDLSPNGNVVFILLDAFTSPAFEHLTQSSPEYKEFFKDFTYYKNATGSFPSTYPSVPAIMSGQEYDNTIPIKKFLTDNLSKSSFPAMFLNNGYRTDLVTIDPVCDHIRSSSCRNMRTLIATDKTALERTELAQLLDVSFFRQAPQPLKKLIYNNEDWFLQAIYESRGFGTPQMSSHRFPDIFEKHATTASQMPTLKFYHLALPHLPIRFDEHCERLKKVNLKTDRDKLYLQQAGCALRITDRVLKKLKEIKAYDNSFIIVLADHGLSVELPSLKYERKMPHPAFASPLLLIKTPGVRTDTSLKESLAPARLADISKTLKDYFNFKEEFPGESILDLKENAQRPRIFRSYKRLKDMWKSEYMPDMKEYQILGSPWQGSNWKFIRDLKAPDRN